LIRQTRRSHLIALAASLAAAGAAEAVEPRDYFGTWSGVLDDGTLRVRVRLFIESTSSARIVIIDQGAAEFRTSDIVLKPGSVVIEIKELKETMSGSMVDANTLRLASSSWSITVDFSRGDSWPPGLLTPERLQETRRESGSPAWGVAHAKATGPITVHVDGLRSVDDKVPVAVGDLWLLASVSKSMTGTLVARLVESGGISWDATVGDILGGVAPGMLDVYKRVTFRHLLSHHAGLQRLIEDADLTTFSRFPLDDAREERLRYAGIALKQAPASTPGERMLYANNGYVIAGAMLEVQFGQRWEKLIEAHVFRPLGLNSIGFGPPGTPGHLDQPLGHLRQRDTGALVPGRPGSGVPIDLAYVLGPAGRVRLNLGDLITYLRAHLQRPEDFLGGASWTMLHTPPFTPGYAMGWFIGDGGALYHSGSTPWWQAYAGVNHASGVVAAVTANINAPKTAGAVNSLFLDALLTAAS
jgi:CubicO group peptidase (beta-lactamase class C family)